MSANPNAPYIFLVFASHDIKRHSALDRLRDEARQLQNLLEINSSCQLILRQNAVLEDVFNTFKKNPYRERISVFHFAGHADSYSLLLENAKREALRADANGFAAFLAEQPGLHLVFLNGCSTQEQVQGLLDAGVQVVIATTERVPDEWASPFASDFYKSLVSGASIASAYRDDGGSVVLFHIGLC